MFSFFLTISRFYVPYRNYWYRFLMPKGRQRRMEKKIDDYRWTNFERSDPEIARVTPWRLFFQASGQPWPVTFKLQWTIVEYVLPPSGPQSAMGPAISVELYSKECRSMEYSPTISFLLARRALMRFNLHCLQKSPRVTPVSAHLQTNILKNS